MSAGGDGMEWKKLIDLTRPDQIFDQIQLLLEEQRRQIDDRWQRELANQQSQYQQQSLQFQQQQAQIQAQTQQKLDDMEQKYLALSVERTVSSERNVNGVNAAKRAAVTHEVSPGKQCAGAQHVQNDLLGNANTVKRFHAGRNTDNKDKRTTKSDSNAKPIDNGTSNVIIEKNISSSSNGDSSPSAVDDSMQTNGTSENSVGWQPVITAAQKKAAKRTSKENAKVTPIQLERMDVARLRDFGSGLMKEMNSNEIILQRFGANQSPRINCETVEAKSKVIAHLKRNRIEFNSFNNKDSKRRAYIVRGVLGNSDEEALDMIEFAVRGTGIDTDIEISRFITPYERFNPSANRAPLFKLVVPSSVDERLLLGIRVIGYCGVKIEAMKKSEIIQCRNCQRLHHTTGQCNFNYRCVQCVAVHAWGACSRKENMAIPIGCVNCLEAKLDHTLTQVNS